MGTAAYGGNGFKGRAAVSGERPIGAASTRRHVNPPPPLLASLPSIVWNVHVIHRSSSRP